MSYDPPAVLRAFTERYGIEYPLLSDTGSAVIRRFGVLNREMQEGTANFGIPYPGTFVVGRDGVVTHRFFEDTYQERDAVSSMLLAVGAGPAGPAATVETNHLRAVVTVSDPSLVPGHRFSIVYEVEPRPGIHVYAPGNHDYRPFTPRIDQAALAPHDITWPPSSEYFFEPLNERVPVYDRPFRVVQPITLKLAEGNDLLKAGQPLDIDGVLSYQACDDKVCFLPVRVPFRLAVPLRPLIRERPAKP